MSSTNLAKPKHPDWPHSYEEYKQLLKLPLANKIDAPAMDCWFEKEVYAQ